MNIRFETKKAFKIAGLVAVFSQNDDFPGFGIKYSNRYPTKTWRRSALAKPLALALTTAQNRTTSAILSVMEFWVSNVKI